MSFKIVKKYSSTEDWFQMGTLSLSLSHAWLGGTCPPFLYILSISLSLSLHGWVGL